MSWSSLLVYLFSLFTYCQGLDFQLETIAQDLHPSVHWIVQADINNDGKPDLISVVFGSNGQHIWFENTLDKNTLTNSTRFQPHPLTSGKPGAIHMAIGDINDDGFVDVILAYKWGECFMKCTREEGKVVWLENPGSRVKQGVAQWDTAEWKEHVIVEQFGTGVHRVLFIDRRNDQGQGEVYVLASGMVAADSTSDHDYLEAPALQVLYRRRQLGLEWEAIELSNSLYLVHEVYIQDPRLESDAPVLSSSSSSVPNSYTSSSLVPQNLLVTSYEGVFKVDLDTFEHTVILNNATRPTSFDKAGWISSFTPFILPTLSTDSPRPARTFASIEPLHGNILALYEQNDFNGITRTELDKRSFRVVPIPSSYFRHQEEDSLFSIWTPDGKQRNHVYEHGGHDVIQMDFDCDGEPEIFAAWRGSDSYKGKGLVMYKKDAHGWTSHLIVKGSFNHFEVNDFDGDGQVYRGDSYSSINDIAVAGWGTFDQDHSIQVLLNRQVKCQELLAEKNQDSLLFQ